MTVLNYSAYMSTRTWSTVHKATLEYEIGLSFEAPSTVFRQHFCSLLCLISPLESSEDLSTKHREQRGLWV